MMRIKVTRVKLIAALQNELGKRELFNKALRAAHDVNVVRWRDMVVRRMKARLAQYVRAKTANEVRRIADAPEGGHGAPYFNNRELLETDGLSRAIATLKLSSDESLMLDAKDEYASYLR